MVCLGNICRSPLAHGILQHKINALSLDWTVDSAGTGSWHVGKLPDSRSISIAQKMGIDITNQRARQFRSIDFDDFDQILVMDTSNYNDVIKLTHDPHDKGKVEMIMNFLSPGRNISVPDPYWDDNGFQKVFDMLDQATDAFIESTLAKNEVAES